MNISINKLLDYFYTLYAFRDFQHVAIVSKRDCHFLLRSLDIR